MAFEVSRFLLLVCLLYGPADLAIARKAPDFKVTDIDGKPWQLYQELASGKTVVLDFFFVDCGPCEYYTPELNQLYLDYGGDLGNVTIIGISDRDDNAYISKFKDSFHVNFPSCGEEGGGKEVTQLFKKAFNFDGVPKYAVVCPDKTIHWDVDRDLGMEEMRAIIDECPTSKSPDTGDGVSLFPNPTHGALQVVLDTSIQTSSLVVYSSSGIKVASVESEVRLHQVSLNLSRLGSGVYFLYFEKKDKTPVCKRIIIE